MNYIFIKSPYYDNKGNLSIQGKFQPRVVDGLGAGAKIY